MQKTIRQNASGGFDWQYEDAGVKSTGTEPTEEKAIAAIEEAQSLQEKYGYIGAYVVTTHCTQTQYSGLSIYNQIYTNTYLVLDKSFTEGRALDALMAERPPQLGYRDHSVCLHPVSNLYIVAAYNRLMESKQ